MSSSLKKAPRDRPAPIWPWALTSLVLFIAGLYFLRPDPNDVDGSIFQRSSRPVAHLPSSNPSPEKSDDTYVNIGPEQGTLRLAFVDSADSTFERAGLLFCRRVEEVTSGRIKIKVYPDGKIGNVTLDELGILTAMQKGQISFAFITCAPLTNISPRLEVMDLPFLFKDYAHADRVMLGDIGKQMLATVNTGGLIGLGSLELGFRIFSSSLPLLSFDDFRGKRLRVMQSAASMSLVRLMGAEAVPSPVNKIYQMAKEGYIDAADRTYPTYWDFKLYEVHHHISETRHSYSTKFILTTDKFMSSLNDADRKAVMGVVREVEISQRKDQRAEELRVKQECIKRGIKIHEFTPEQREGLAKVAQSLYDEYITVHGGDLLKGIRASANTSTPVPVKGTQ